MLKPEWPKAKRIGMVGISHQSCSLAGMGSANLVRAADRTGVRIFILGMSMFCPGQDSHEPVQLTASRSRWLRLHTPQWPSRRQVQAPLVNMLSLPLLPRVQEWVCLPAAGRRRALPWGGSTSPAPWWFSLAGTWSPASPQCGLLLSLTQEEREWRARKKEWAEAEEEAAARRPAGPAVDSAAPSC